MTNIAMGIFIIPTEEIHTQKITPGRKKKRTLQKPV